MAKASTTKPRRSVKAGSATTKARRPGDSIERRKVEAGARPRGVASERGGAPSLPQIPPDAPNAVLKIGDRSVKLTNLQKPFWPELGVTKRDLIQYYIDLSPALLPHLQHRAMVMKRYPHGYAGGFFFMKRAPSPRPEWIQTCSIQHDSGNIIDFPVVEDLATLVWIINLGCIDLNPWYARCDDVDRPDYLHFDLDPVSPKPGEPDVPFAKVRDVALVVRDALQSLGMPSYPKTTGSRGIHVYVPIRRGPLQKEVWTFAKSFAQTLAAAKPELITAEYRIAKRPAGRVLVDYNQNAWGRTLSSVYSIRPKAKATASAPVTWDEVEAGVDIDDFRIDNMRQRVADVGDLWAPLAEAKDRVDLTPYLKKKRGAAR